MAGEAIRKLLAEVVVVAALSEALAEQVGVRILCGSKVGAYSIDGEPVCVSKLDDIFWAR